MLVGHKSIYYLHTLPNVDLVLVIMIGYHVVTDYAGLVKLLPADWLTRHTWPSSHYTLLAPAKGLESGCFNYYSDNIPKSNLEKIKEITSVF